MPAGLDGNPSPIVTRPRRQLLDALADAVERRRRGDPILVAIDGASATGKSTTADELAAVLRDRGHRVVRASIDSFHRPRAERHARGPISPEGYYRDSHQLDALQRRLLDPFRRGAGHFVSAVFDEPSDSPVDHGPQPVPAEGILVFDGLFLHRPELVDHWNLGAYLTAPARRESMFRTWLDGAGDRAEAQRRRAVIDRYIEGQAIYEREARPAERADVVIDNDDLAAPHPDRPPPW